MSSAADPTLRDGGVSIMMRSWALEKSESAGGCVADPGTRITGAHDVFVVPFAYGERSITRGSSNFGEAFNREEPASAHSEVMWQLWFKAIGDYRTDWNKIGAEDADRLTHNGDPVRMYLETVLRPVPTSASSSSSSSRMMDVSSAEMLSRLASGPSAYLSELPGGGLQADELLVELRLWVFVFEPPTFGLDLASNFRNIIEDNSRYYNAFFTGQFNPASSNAGKLPGKKEAQATLAAAGLDDWMLGGAGGPTLYSGSLRHSDKWRLVTSWTKWAELCDLIMGVKVLTLPDITDRVRSYKTDWHSNPGNPRRVFSPAAFFALPMPLIDRRQARFLGAYRLDTDTETGLPVYTWPVPSRVITIPEPDQNVSRISIKYLPHYQLRAFSHGLDYSRLRASRTAGGIMPSDAEPTPRYCG